MVTLPPIVGGLLQAYVESKWNVFDKARASPLVWDTSHSSCRKCSSSGDSPVKPETKSSSYFFVVPLRVGIYYFKSWKLCDANECAHISHHLFFHFDFSSLSSLFYIDLWFSNSIFLLFTIESICFEFKFTKKVQYKQNNSLFCMTSGYFTPFLFIFWEISTVWSIDGTQKLSSLCN